MEPTETNQLQNDIPLSSISLLPDFSCFLYLLLFCSGPFSLFSCLYNSLCLLVSVYLCFLHHLGSGRVGLGGDGCNLGVFLLILRSFIAWFARWSVLTDEGIEGGVDRVDAGMK